MKCPACKNALREKNAGNLVVDMCYGGCGGIWFDQDELTRVDPRAATTLHTVWRDPNQKVVLTEPRPCPKCDNSILERRMFGESKGVEIDQCPKCGGVWLDEGEFTRVQEAIRASKLAPPGWALAIAAAAQSVRG